MDKTTILIYVFYILLTILLLCLIYFCSGKKEKEYKKQQSLISKEYNDRLKNNITFLENNNFFDYNNYLNLVTENKSELTTHELINILKKSLTEIKQNSFFLVRVDQILNNKENKGDME